jgi:hypothetical protein
MGHSGEVIACAKDFNSNSKVDTESCENSKPDRCIVAVDTE